MTTKRYLSDIRKSLDNGDKVASQIEGRLLLVKRRFVETIVGLVDESFFKKSEAEEGFGGFQVESFRKSIAAAYNLRSKYVHTGAPFGRWVSLQMGGRNQEVQVGKPVVNDKELSKILEHAPTLVGLGLWSDIAYTNLQCVTAPSLNLRLVPAIPNIRFQPTSLPTLRVVRATAEPGRWTMMTETFDASNIETPALGINL